MSDTDTPRTEKEYLRVRNIQLELDRLVIHARRLERELAVAREVLKEITDIDGCSLPGHLADKTLARLDAMKEGK